MIPTSLLAASLLSIANATPYGAYCQPLQNEGQARMRSLTAQIEREREGELRQCTDTHCAQRAKARAAQRLKQVELVEARMQRQIRECKDSLPNEPPPPPTLALAVAEYEAARNQCAGNPDCLVQARLRAASVLTHRHQETMMLSLRSPTVPPMHSSMIAQSRFPLH